MRGAKFVGAVFTVQCLPRSILTIRQVLLPARLGDVLVVDGQEDPSIGELMARDARAAGLAGIVVDGAVREAQGLRDFGFPTFARALMQCVAASRRLGTIDLEVACAGVVVRPGDWIVSDDDGVVVVPWSRPPISWSRG